MTRNTGDRTPKDSQLERIFREGTTSNPWRPDGSVNTQRMDGKPSNRIKCADGFTLSVIAGWGTYCSPRPGSPFGDSAPETYEGPYFEVEVGFPSERPEPWDQWQEYCEDPDDPTDTVYAYVPRDLVRQLVESHGGEEPS